MNMGAGGVAKKLHVRPTHARGLPGNGIATRGWNAHKGGMPNQAEPSAPVPQALGPKAPGKKIRIGVAPAQAQMGQRQ